MKHDKATGRIRLVPKTIVHNHIRHFSPFIPIYLEKKNFIIKTADNAHELNEALRLRHDVFLKEQLHKSTRSGQDFDRFDKRCDHLLIIEKATKKLIGTYRMQSSLHTRKWYTATEFHMKYIRKLPGNKLELGRACVHQDYRNGVTIALLWEGIHAYMVASNTRYMFGCSSIKTVDKDEIRTIYNYLKQQNHLTEEHKIRPRSKFQVHGLRQQIKKSQRFHSNLEASDIMSKIPSLLQSYLKVGAKVCGKPALDKSFRCVDFLTLLDVSDLREQYLSRIKRLNDPVSCLQLTE